MPKNPQKSHNYLKMEKMFISSEQLDEFQWRVSMTSLNDEFQWGVSMTSFNDGFQWNFWQKRDL